MLMLNPMEVWISAVIEQAECWWCLRTQRPRSVALCRLTLCGWVTAILRFVSVTVTKPYILLSPYHTLSVDRQRHSKAPSILFHQHRANITSVVLRLNMKPYCCSLILISLLNVASTRHKKRNKICWCCVSLWFIWLLNYYFRNRMWT